MTPKEATVLNRILAELRGRVSRMWTQTRNAILRFTVTRGGDGTCQGTTWASTVVDGAEHLEPYGIASRPTPGAQGLRLVIAADSGHDVVILLGGGNRPSLADGEVAAYHPGTGARVHFRADGSIDLVPAGGGFVNVGGSPAAAALSLDNLLQTELAKIATTLGTGSNGAGPVVFGTPYVPGSTAATKAKGT